LPRLGRAGSHERHASAEGPLIGADPISQPVRLSHHRETLPTGNPILPIMRSIKVIVFLIIILNAILLFSSLDSEFVGADEVRQIPGGLAIWKTVSFALANDSPPLAKLTATVPALTTKINFYGYDLAETGILLDSCLREREEGFGAHFAYANATKYLSLVRWARATGWLWWLLGAWVIGLWARELYGDRAVVIALILWGLGPNVIAHERVATPALASAVSLALAMHTLRRFFKDPSWFRAGIAGLFLGMAQLIDFTSLALYLIWPVMALAHCRRPNRLSCSVAKVLGTVGLTAMLLLMSVWIINLGYGLHRGRPLEEYNFVSRGLGADSRSGRPPSGGQPTGNRFRGTWLGRVTIPLPAEYVSGLDRRWHEGETACTSRGDGEALNLAVESPLATLGAKVPLGVWVMVCWSLALTIIRHPGSARWPDELDLWLPGMVILVMTTLVSGSLPPSEAIILLAPFGAVIASKLALYLHPGRWRAGWLVLALLFWAVGSGLASHPAQRAYLNEAVGVANSVTARMRHGPFDGGPDLLALKDWLRKHSEIRLRGMAVRDPLGPQISGLRYPAPPANPGPAVAGDPSYTRRFGPYPGDYALDPYHLKEEKYHYFSHLTPIARVGASIVVYRITREDADRVRRELGLAALDERDDSDGKTESGLLYRTFVDSRGVASHYALFVPPEYRGDRPYPLILFLHGFGDRGTEGHQYTAVGLPPALESQKDGFGFLVLCPQGQSGKWETEQDDTRRTMELLSQVEKAYRVDPKRIYLTGLSSGGTGVWDWAATFPDRWAAIVPVASVGDPVRAATIKNIPCWCFHNSHDASSPVENPRMMIRAMRFAGGTPRYTEFFGLNHNVWDRAYSMPDLYDWLLRQRRP
jgi:poly(3-hydroxybutyrate) depolymerase